MSLAGIRMFPTATPRRPFAQLELSRLLPRALLLAIAFAIGPTTLSAQSNEAVDAVAVAKIRDDAFNRSQVMMLMSISPTGTGPASPVLLSRAVPPTTPSRNSSRRG